MHSLDGRDGHRNDHTLAVVKVMAKGVLYFPSNIRYTCTCNGVNEEVERDFS